MATLFPEFHLAFPPGEGHEPYDPARHDAYADRVPPEVLHEWREFGFGSYGQGIIWTVSPDERFLNPDEWPTLEGVGVELLRSALGDFLLWRDGAYLWFNIFSGWMRHSTHEPVMMFSKLAEPESRKQLMFEKIFTQARSRLGPMTKDECYGLTNLSTFGGFLKERHLIKEPMRPYLSRAAAALAQLSTNRSAQMVVHIQLKQK
jgi:hypothetical protein